MFPTRVRAQTGELIDLNRAQFLMDSELREQALMLAHHDTPPPKPACAEDVHVKQVFFQTYCKLHAAKFGREFPPNVDPDWK